MKVYVGEVYGKKWKCCGVFVELVVEYNVVRDVKLYRYNGRLMVGGCGIKCGCRDIL